MNIPLPCVMTRSIGSLPIGNTGLWFDKFFDRWDADFSAVAPEGKSAWVKQATHTPAGTADLLLEARSRMEQLVMARDGRMLYFKTDGRFVTGLGRAHPVENGFSWHHGLGTPYLAGSSIKGLTRAWASQTEVAGTDIARVLGSQDSKQPQVGSVDFLDALPIAPVMLDADVMTPHYAPYYEDSSDTVPPADWHDPRPIPFLTVADGQAFAFGLLPRNLADANDCELASRWLVDALTWLGAGAKTAVGYGRFRADEKATGDAASRARDERDAREREAAMQQRLRGLSPLAQELERNIADHHWGEDKNAFAQTGVIEGWLDKLEADAQIDAITRLGELISHHFPGLLEEPDKLQGKNLKLAFKDRQRRFAKRLNELA